MAKSWTDQKEFDNKSKEPRLDELIPIRKLKPGAFERFRFIGPKFAFAEHWIGIRKKNGETVKIRKLCHSFDQVSGEFKNECPYCSILGDKPRKKFLTCAIDRAAEKNKPRRAPTPKPSESKTVKLWDGESKGRIKDKSSDSWTPVTVLGLPTSAGGKIYDIVALNTKTINGETVMFGPEHAKYGFDVMIKHDSSRSPAEQYSIQKAKRTPLTDEEKQYLLWKLDIEKPESPEAALKEAKSMGSRRVSYDKDGKAYDNFITGSDEKKSKKGSSNKDDIDLDDMEEDDAPKKSKNKSKSKSKDKVKKKKVDKKKSKTKTKTKDKKVKNKKKSKDDGLDF